MVAYDCISVLQQTALLVSILILVTPPAVLLALLDSTRTPLVQWSAHSVRLGILLQQLVAMLLIFVMVNI